MTEPSSQIPRSTNNRKRGKYLHLVPDNKFIDAAHELFEAVAPGQNDFLLLKGNGTKTAFIKTFSPARQDVSALRAHDLEYFADYDAVFVHYLNASARLAIDRAPAETRFIWIGWGSDYYHLICDPDELLLPNTRNILAALPTLETSPHRSRRKMAIKIVRQMINPALALRRRAVLRRIRDIAPGQPGEKRLLERISIFAPVLQSDFDAVMAGTASFPAKYARWNYPVALPEPARSASACNILVGNSADPTNNHLDTFQLIRASVGPEQKIICPLSYGNPYYGDAVASAGSTIFGAQFQPLRTFMPSNKYAEILATCSIAAMNHVRQQALGNTLVMLWFGARVFLNSRSPIFKEMRNLDVAVYNICELADYLKAPRQSSSNEELAKTREHLSRRYGREALLSLTRDLLRSAQRDANTATPHPWTH